MTRPRFNALATGVAFLLVLLLSGFIWSKVQAAQTQIDLTQTVIVTPSTLSGPENKAVQMLIEEVEKRSGVRWQRAEKAPDNGAFPIHIGRADPKKPLPREGYQLQTATNSINIIGNDERGILFGVGHLLRKLQMTRGQILLNETLNLTTAPKYPMRGHQLGYRPKTNSYDAWTLPMWEQYIRDLAIFGTNAIELIPPRSDDAADSPHFPRSQIETMIGMSRICDEYGIDVWIWYPALDQNYADPKQVEFALNEWGEVFRKLPRIDALLVPGGDPGHTQPKYLMPLLEKQTANLRRYHPKGQMWVAPQGFTSEWLDEFLGIVKTEPNWLTGIVYGPQMRWTLPKLRAAVPAKYPIRQYPDITHSRHSQYPVADWDSAFALTEAREVINPRPAQMAHIFRVTQPDTIGFITYSEGCNDDVNKIVWNGLGWNPDADVMEILRDYSRYFISPALADSFAQGLLALERNWQGAVISNGGINTTLQQFQAMEQSASPQDLLNWRFQQALYRAYYDAYIRSRVIYETSLEENALSKLREARSMGALTAMAQAEAILDRAVTERTATDLRARVFELAEALYQSIRMQLHVERYKAIAVGRGANLNTIDFPLNNRLWLKKRFSEIRQPFKDAASEAAPESERLKQIDAIVNWTNPGPGGFYDDLGNLTRQPHLVREPGFAKDPAFLESSILTVVNPTDSSGARTVFGDFTPTGMGLLPEGPRSWWDLAESFYDTPLKMRYTGLDRTAQYSVRVVYVGDKSRDMKLVADDKFEIHPLIKKESRPLEFDIPLQATADGELNLTWTQAPGSRGAGRGTQVAEIWLIKKNCNCG
ncbi:MAG TPA: glycoside hydrolase family 20 zincin-like fold domain-containing protein [Blastocatellia bacterium]